MKFIGLAVTLTSFLLASPAHGYPVDADTLNCRSSPSTSASIVRTYTRGANIDISCQTTGTKVLTTTIWDKTQHGCYVSDYYVKTGHSGFIPGVPRCDGTTPPTSGGPCTSVNGATLDLIKVSEGFVDHPRGDPTGNPTVGYGHRCQTKGCSEAGPFPLTRERGMALLLKDVQRFTKCIGNMLNDSVRLNDNQFGALVDWAYNMGCGAAESSTLVKRLNKGENPITVVSEELPKWNKAGKPPRVFSGLTKRRNAEVALFKRPSSKEAHPKCT